MRSRVVQHGRSTEAEVREILASVVKPQERVHLGDALVSLGRKSGLTDEELRHHRKVRDKTPAEPLRFE